MGWCRLDGTRNHSEPEIFILLDEAYRNKGYGTQCVKALLRIAAEDYMTAMERSPVKDTEIKILLQAALTDETESRSVFMHSIDASYRYEGYARYKTEDV